MPKSIIASAWVTRFYRAFSFPLNASTAARTVQPCRLSVLSSAHRDPKKTTFRSRASSLVGKPRPRECAEAAQRAASGPVQMS